MPAFTPPTSPTAPAGRSSRTGLLVILLTVAVWLACFHFPITWKITGIMEGENPFLDLRNFLSAAEARQHGLNPYVVNPFDPYGRLHGYTDWWLLAGPLGLTQADNLWIGTLLVAAFLLTAVAVTRPVTPGQGLSLWLCCISPPLLFAVNRANPDLVVFLLITGALAAFRTLNTPLRSLGVMLLAVAAVLKYFPLAAAILLLEARTRRELAGWALLYALVLALAWPSLAEGLRVAAQHTPEPKWLYAFGAPMVFRDLGLPGQLGWMLAGLIALGGTAWWWREGLARAVASASDRDRQFACGAVMVVGCFLHGSSYSYKLIFAVWLLPWLWTAPALPADRNWWRATRVLLVLVLGFEGLATVLINLGFLAGWLPAHVARRGIQMAVLCAQLPAWALMACLGRGLALHLLGQARRLGWRLPFGPKPA